MLVWSRENKNKCKQLGKTLLLEFRMIEQARERMYEFWQFFFFFRNMFGQFCPVWWASFNTYFYMLNNFVQFFIRIYIRNIQSALFKFLDQTVLGLQNFPHSTVDFFWYLIRQVFFFFQINSVFNGWNFFWENQSGIYSVSILNKCCIIFAFGLYKKTISK